MEQIKMVNHNMPKAFDKGIKQGLLTKNGKKRLLSTFNGFHGMVNCWSGCLYTNGIVLAGKLNGYDLHGDTKNRYVLINTVSSDDFKRLTIFNGFYTRKELKDIAKSINILMKLTKTKKKRKTR